MKKINLRKLRGANLANRLTLLIVIFGVAIAGAVYLLVSHADTINRVAITSNGTLNGYWVTTSNGYVYPIGSAGSFGDLTTVKISAPVVGMASSADGKGYWLVGSNGGVYAFGDASFHGSLPGDKVSTSNIVGMASSADGKGYWLVGSNGGVYAFGSAFYGSSAHTHLNAPISGIASSADGRGYYLIAQDGRVFCFGSASFKGSSLTPPTTTKPKSSPPPTPENTKPATNQASTATPSAKSTPTASSPAASKAPLTPAKGDYFKADISPIGIQSTSNLGYWLASTNGSIYSYGDQYKGLVPGSAVDTADIVGLASPSNYQGYWTTSKNGRVYSFGVPYKGSMPGIGIRVDNIVGIAAASDGRGYWLAGADGGVFAFGVPFKNSLPGIHVKVNDIVGIAALASGNGYYLAGADGGVFAFGDASYFGGLGSQKHQPVVGISTDPSGGYWLLTSDGGVFSYGGAKFYGSASGRSFNGHAVAISATSDGKGYYLAMSDGSVFAFGDAKQQQLEASLNSADSAKNSCQRGVDIPNPYPTWNYPPPVANSSPLPSIKIDTISGQPTLVDSADMQPFVVRGSFYYHAANSTSRSTGKGICGRATFDTGPIPDHYDPHQAAQALSQMHQLGYNTIKAGVDPNEVGNPNGRGLDPKYLANMANFINLARANQIRVWFSVGYLPTDGGYMPASFYDKKSPLYQNVNDFFVPSANFIPKEQAYIADLLTGLKNAGADMSDLLSVEIWGEQYFNTFKWPINTDLAHHNYKQIDDYLVGWENQMTDTVHKTLPGSLVSISFFPPPKISPTKYSIWIEAQQTFSSKVDLVDLHLYPPTKTVDSSAINTDVARFGFPNNHPKKPVVLGEFGSAKNNPARTVEQASNILTDWEKASCSVPNLKISGWVTWTWNTEPWEQNSFYNMLAGFYSKQYGSTTLGAVLSPSLLPNPCE